MKVTKTEEFNGMTGQIEVVERARQYYQKDLVRYSLFAPM